MITTIFNRSDDWAKQKELALYAMSRVRTLRILEVSTVDYASSLALAKLIQKLDNKREIREILVYMNFVRIFKNEEKELNFSCMVTDVYGASFYSEWVPAH